MERVSITAPERLQLHMDSKCLYGYDQEWFTLPWKRMAGCGPTVAAMQAAYLRGERLDRREALCAMEVAWRFVTPGMMGLNTTERYLVGMEKMLAHLRQTARFQALDIPGAHDARPGAAQMADFIREGLERDCPVAFLNLHAADLPNLEDWHWICVVAMEGDAIATCYDNGNLLTLPLEEWRSRTHRGGGFVALR